VTCMTASNSDLFDQMFFTPVRRRTSDAEPLAVPRSLFDFPMEHSRRRVFDWSVRPEDDLERWDGLS
jgi:hypothetical protein